MFTIAYILPYIFCSIMWPRTGDFCLIKVFCASYVRNVSTAMLKFVYSSHSVTHDPQHTDLHCACACMRLSEPRDGSSPAKFASCHQHQQTRQTFQLPPNTLGIFRITSMRTVHANHHSRNTSPPHANQSADVTFSDLAAPRFLLSLQKSTCRFAGRDVRFIWR